MGNGRVVGHQIRSSLGPSRVLRGGWPGRVCSSEHDTLPEGAWGKGTLKIHQRSYSLFHLEAPADRRRLWIRPAGFADSLRDTCTRPFQLQTRGSGPVFMLLSFWRPWLGTWRYQPYLRCRGQRQSRGDRGAALQILWRRHCGGGHGHQGPWCSS